MACFDPTKTRIISISSIWVYSPDQEMLMADATWRKLIEQAFKATKESWADVESCTLSEAELDVEFDDGYGGSEGKPFTLWTHKRVYFPTVYDGSEWVSSVRRHPDDQPTSHVGGE